MIVTRGSRMTSDGERCTIPSAGQPVSGVMSRALLRIDLDATLEETRDLLAAYGVHHLLVFESERLVGVIYDRDVLSHTSPNIGTMAERRDDTETLRRRVFHAASYKPVTVPRRAAIAAAAVRCSTRFPTRLETKIVMPTDPELPACLRSRIRRTAAGLPVAICSQAATSLHIAPLGVRVLKAPRNGVFRRLPGPRGELTAPRWARLNRTRTRRGRGPSPRRWRRGAGGGRPWRGRRLRGCG